MTPPGGAVLGPRHHDVRRLRTLLRDAKVRAAEAAFVLEGPRVVEGALERGAPVDTIYLADGAAPGFPRLLERASDAGVQVVQLRDGVVEKVGTTRTPQPVLAVAPIPAHSIEELPASGVVVVTVDVADPGNLGTIVRSAEASGAVGVVATGGASVDVHHPKVVRSSAGAIFGVPVIQRADPLVALRALGVAGRRRLGARVRGGVPHDGIDLTVPCAVVLGNEARGLDGDDLEREIDVAVSIPLAGDAESLNVAMAAAVLCFEAARQRRAVTVTP